MRSVERGIGHIAAVARSCQDFPGSILEELEVCNFSYFGTISI